MGANSSNEVDSTTAGEANEADKFSMQLLLPDVVVRRVFSNLDFNEIKSCRLVCKPWHRHALDGINFILYIEDVGPTRSLRKRIFSSKEASSRDRFNYKLYPYVAKASKEEALKNIISDIMERREDAKKPKKLCFDQIDAGISSLKPNIKGIYLEFASSNKRMHPVLQTVVENFPDANFISAWCDELGIGFKLEEDKGAVSLGSQAAALKLPKLSLGGRKADDVTATAPIIAPFIQQAASEAAWISIYSCQNFWLRLHEVERSSDEATIFKECKELEVAFSKYTDQFDRVNSFPSVEKLEVRRVWSVENITGADFISSWEQMANLKQLTIESVYDGLELPSLRLPNLIHLELQRTNLPSNPLQFDSTGLQELVIQGGENLRRLANHARRGGCKSLKTLKLRRIETDAVTEYLPAILNFAKGQQTLNIEGEGFEVITETCIKVAAASPRNLAELECDGDHKVPVEVGAKQFVRELVAWHQLTGLKTPLVLHCRTCEGSQLANGLGELLRQSTEIDIDGTLITAAVRKSTSSEIDFDMAMRNNVNGTLQKLRIRLSIQQQWEFERDVDYGDFD